MRKYALMAMAPLLLSACYDDHNYGGISGPSANFQVIHASPDTPSLTVLIDGQPLFGDLHYGEGTGELQVTAGSHTLSMQAETPTGAVTVIPTTTINFAQGNDYVVAAEGPYASIGSDVFPHALSTVDPSATRIQVLNAAPTEPSIAVYLTAPGADLTASTPLGAGSLAFMGATAPADVTSGSYEIRITAAGTTTPVLFDSGAITLIGGTDLVITALQNVGPGTAPVVLGLTDAFGNDSTLFDISTPATLRVVNASPNSPPLSVTVFDNSGPLVPAVGVVIGAPLAYESFTQYESQAPGNYTIQFTPASNVNQTVTSLPLTLNAGTQQTIYALGAYATLGTEATFDNRRRVATGAKLRLVQASPAAGFVDVYLTAPGAGIASMAPAIVGIPFGGDTGFQQVVAGSYDLTITTAGTQTVLAGPTTISVSNTGIYTIASRDAPGGGAPFGLILMDDFAP
jgi:hypothetical protein